MTTKRDLLDSGLDGNDVAPADPSAPLLSVDDLASLLRFGTANATRRFATKHLRPALVSAFGGKRCRRWCRAKVLTILGLEA